MNGALVTSGQVTTVQDVLDHKGHDVWCIAPDESVYDALAMMAKRGVGALVVTRGSEILGLLSERDYARKIILRGESSRETRVERIMTTSVITTEPSRTIHECMATMTAKRVRHLPVVVDGVLNGLVSIGDVVSAVIRQQEVEIELLHSYIHGG